MAARNSTSAEGQLAPEQIMYHCTHIEKVSDRPMVRRIYERLVQERLTEPPGKIAYLQQYCNACLGRERETDQYRGQRGTWFEMVTQPLKVKGSDCGDRVSLMLMFVKMWSALTDVKLIQQLRDDRDGLMYDGFRAFRYWCKTVAQNMNTEEDPDALSRLIGVIEHFYGHFVRREVEWVMGHYQRLRPISRWRMERVWPVANIANYTDRSEQFLDQVRVFRHYARETQAFPADLSAAFAKVCLGASAWSSELLAPPQQSDMRLEVLGPHVERSKVVSQSDVKSLSELINAVNVESMLFKCQLYQFYQLDDRWKKASKRDLNYMLDAIGYLERLYSKLHPLEDKLREAWDKWVEFSKPFADLLRVKPEEET
ncbi:hypothetical protein PG993_011956 [Apiospora rasikravindrae]|uniref:Uncharacterized protein n=1 Tax=Apiospora rasikravindrae TaxID=990691 RepID=A0ABR1S148_9PEZI